MIAEIMATGEEIRSGALIDSNSAFIAEKLEEIGAVVTRHTCVGDDLGFLISTFKEIGNRADIAVVTGGLGPTSDDLSAQAAAEAAGVALAQNQSARQSLEKFFKVRKRAINPASLKQALLPQGAQCIANPIGTAPGFRLEIGKCLFFFLPGVPDEMQRMLSDTVLPQLGQILGAKRNFFRVKTLSTFGLTESKTFERLADLENTFPGISLGLRVKFPEIQVKLYANGSHEEQLNENLQSAARWVIEKLGNKVFSQQGDSMEKTTGQLLKAKQATLAVAESCTGGLISHMLTNISGSSEYFVFCGITYSNQAKIDILNVSAETIKIHGAVHEETAKEMALGVQRISGATYGLATSGIAGPTGGTQDKPIGTVCIGLATPHDCAGYRFHFWFGDRMFNKQVFAVAALEVLRRELLGLGPPHF
ncbi:MAG: CinA family nicotinamide mononucleotide deamidase-related protein [Desulfobacterales bacterium]|jgi:nicotinamide-nucleotide amidase